MNQDELNRLEEKGRFLEENPWASIFYQISFMQTVIKAMEESNGTRQKST